MHQEDAGTHAGNGGLRVVYVDDSEIQLRHYTGLMEGAGFQVSSHLSYETAFPDLLRADLDLAVFDFMMPGKTGLELLEELRQVQPDLPVVLLTVSPDHEGIERARQEWAGLGWLRVVDKSAKPRFFLQECRSLVLEAEHLQKDRKSLQLEYDRFRALHQAAGLLAGFSYGGSREISPNEAVEMIRQEARRKGIKMDELARRVSETPALFAAMFRSQPES